MIDRQKGKYVFECDGCYASLNTEERDFQTALDVMRNEGWRSTRDGPDEQWKHYCPRC